ncbi:3D (Asp-Asp-Asp) domain-containing protein [Hungatella effluvii]|uniref:3D (Asp-Asp-Asp) domain-containing protein n=1 Tax=Hungatella effluvii TaxID=1096246 RepID=A0A2V3XXE7_9FIRM|nr:3D domain-containing protein [Hungatella effluvii]PXX49214.1 3D (Asp-Asp-Asp) domain-containing protein [Hungatella effluvii]
MIRFLTVAGFTVIVAARAYSFVSEGASGRDYIDVPPLTDVLESAEAPGVLEETAGNTVGPGVLDKTAESTVPVEMPGEGAVNKNALQTEISESTYLGEFEVTGYCGCDLCCGKKEIKLTKMETVPKPGHTVAADPEVITLGSSIVINGVTYQVEDVGQAIKGNSIDIFFATHEEAIEFGRQKMSVYLKQSL